MQDVAIHCVGMGHTYGAVQALLPLSLSVPRGQICGYVGPNGAGKSTTVRILAGLQEPTEGSAHLFGQRAGSLEARRLLGYVPESGAVYGALTVSEHLRLVGDLHDLPETLLESRVGHLLERFGLGAEAHRALAELSKGMRQKVLLAAALLPEPPVLLLDEPLSGLDANAAAEVKDLLRDRAAAGGTVLFASHILEVVESLCDRVVILHRGAIVLDEERQGLRRRHAGQGLEKLFRELTASTGIAS